MAHNENFHFIDLRSEYVAAVWLLLLLFAIVNLQHFIKRLPTGKQHVVVVKREMKRKGNNVVWLVLGVLGHHLRCLLSN